MSLSGGEASLAGNQHLTGVVDTDEAMKYSNVSVNFHNLKSENIGTRIERIKEKSPSVKISSHCPFNDVFKTCLYYLLNLHLLYCFICVPL